MSGFTQCAAAGGEDRLGHSSLLADGHFHFKQKTSMIQENEE